MALVLCSLLCSAVVLLIILMHCFHCPTVRASVCVCVLVCKGAAQGLASTKKQREMERKMKRNLRHVLLGLLSLSLRFVSPSSDCLLLSPVACAITFAAAHCLLWVTLFPPSCTLLLSLAVAVAAFWVMSISRAAGNIICPGSPAGIHFNSVQRLLLPLLLVLLPSTHPHP